MTVLSPTPTPLRHSASLSRKQVETILQQWMETEDWTERVRDCLFKLYQNDTYRVLILDNVEWWYLDDGSDRWIVTAVGRSCDGVQRWYLNDNTGEITP